MHNNENTWRSITVLSAAAFAAACASVEPPVIDKLDEDTGVTVTYSRTPFIFAPDEKVGDNDASEYVEIGMIEINTMGTLRYYVWMGISDIGFGDGGGATDERFRYVDFDIDGNGFRLDAIGSSHGAIGTSEPIYDGLFKSTEDVYFDITLDQVALFAKADNMRFRTADPADPAYVPWYRSVSPQQDLAEFYRVVLE